MTKADQRTVPDAGGIPLIDVGGTAFECGEQLGWAWSDVLRADAERAPAGSRPWWSARTGLYRRLVRAYMPHLPDVYRGMAKGAGVPVAKVGTRVPHEPRAGCTSFAIAPRLTAPLAFLAMADHDGFPMSVCCHGAGINTTAAVVVEPTRGLLHVCRGQPCRNWARTYALE